MLTICHIYYIVSFMSKFKIFLPVIVAAILIISCNTTETKKETGTAKTQHNDTFDPAKVSQSYYTSTRDEVRQFIEKLNQIVRTRNYNSWRDNLSQDYIDEYSSLETLQRISDEPLMKRQNIVLRSLNDYFTRVFVPSRNPDRIQSDINNIEVEFVTASKVRAFITRTNNAGEESREILYNLEKINSEWKITN